MNREAMTISADAFKERIAAEDPYEIIDVRPAVLYRACHVMGARNVEGHTDLLAAMKQREKGVTTYLVCNEGNMSKATCQKLTDAGVTDVVNVDGGTSACVRAGLGVEEGSVGMSLERQVRIAAGSLVLLGVVLGFTLHPGFFGVSAFVGAGLVFAGVTNTCGMALLLARAPWNR